MLAVTKTNWNPWDSERYKKNKPQKVTHESTTINNQPLPQVT